MFIVRITRSTKICVEKLSKIFPRSYVVGGSDNGGVSQDDVSQDRFVHNLNVKIRKVVPVNLLQTKQKKEDIRTHEKFTKNMK